MDGTITESRAVLTHHSRSFRLAGRFLPDDQLDEAAVVYAFCRMVDDAADEAPDRNIAEVSLNALEDDLFESTPRDQIVRAFRAIEASRQIPRRAAFDLILGVRSDLDTVRISDDRELTRYGYRVAGTVGLMMCGVLGVTDRTAWQYAVALGVGMQITNICRDVLEDAERGRIYLPADRLAAAGISPDALLTGTADTAALSAVVSDLLDLADTHYAYAEGGMAAIPWRGRLGILIASRLYRAIGVRLRKVHGCDSTHGRTVTTTAEKGLAILGGIACFFHPVTLGLRDSTAPAPFLPPIEATPIRRAHA